MKTSFIDFERGYNRTNCCTDNCFTLVFVPAVKADAVAKVPLTADCVTLGVWEQLLCMRSSNWVIFAVSMTSAHRYTAVCGNAQQLGWKAVLANNSRIKYFVQVKSGNVCNAGWIHRSLARAMSYCSC